jgi:CHAD domain-containing protein
MTEPTTAIEIERKLTVPASFSLDDVAEPLAAIGDVQRERARKLVAVYYDTDDYRLARARVTLRRRTGGNDSGWHLKLPPEGVNGDGRHEVTLPLRAGRPGAVPESLANQVIAITGGAELRPLATQKTTRIPVTLLDDAGQPGVEIVDDTVTVTEGVQAGDAYREIEIEVMSNASLLEPAVRVLAEAGAEPSASASKGVRALVGDALLAPLVDPGDRPKPKDPAADAVMFHLRTQAAAIIKQDQRVRRHLPDAVHQYRVAARRLRSVLQAFGPLVEAEWARSMRTELGWIAAVLGEERDREVLEARLIDAIRALPADVDGVAALVVIQTHLDSEIETARASIEDAMTSERYRDLMASLHTACIAAPVTELARGKAAKVLPPMVEARWKKLAAMGKKLHGELEGHDDHWHSARKDAKKARYTVEACIPVFGSPAKKFAKQLESVTELLGEHQDAAIAGDLLLQLSAKTRGARSAFAMGVLYSQQREQVARCRAQFIEEWPRVSHKSWRHWLEST